jgi:AcrR family transcriptional regulator
MAPKTPTTKSSTAKTATPNPSPKERSAAAKARLLAAANELFYDEGIQTVGIDRVIEHAGVAKATLYSAFGNKEGLIRAYLQARHDATSERMAKELAERYETAKERLVGVFEVQGLSFTDPSFRGCAFIGANADAPNIPAVEESSHNYRAWLHALFLDLQWRPARRIPCCWLSSWCCCTTGRASARGSTRTRRRTTLHARWQPLW